MTPEFIIFSDQDGILIMMRNNTRYCFSSDYVESMFSNDVKESISKSDIQKILEDRVLSYIKNNQDLINEEQDSYRKLKK